MERSNKPGQPSRAMRTLTKEESRLWVESRELVYEPFRERVSLDGQFTTADDMDGGEVARRGVIGVCLQADEVLLVIEDHPLTYADRRAGLGALRRSNGETRALADVPGHLLRRGDDAMLDALLRVCVGPGSWWSTYLYLAPIQTTMLIWESSLVDLWSKRDADRAILECNLKATQLPNKPVQPTRAGGPRG